MEALLHQTRKTPYGFREAAPQAVLPFVGAARIVDVREPFELADGRISGAENVPLGTLDRAARGWRRDEPLILVCRSGARSGRAAAALAAAGFQAVVNLAGGMLAWQAAGLPVERG